jgi:formylglycine-generating enzyme required for sulfatase activity
MVNAHNPKMPLLRLLTGIATLQLLTGCYAHYHIPYWHNDPTQIPACVRIGNNVSMCFGEVTLDDYGEFIIANHFDRSLYPADSALGDQSYKDIFKQLDGVKDMQDFDRKFLRNRTDTGFYYPARDPIVGISFEQAIRFCEWKEAEINSDRPEGKKVRVSLPSIQLYRTLIENIDSVAAPKKQLPCHLATMNYKNSVWFCKPNKWSRMMRYHQLLRVDAFWPSKLGLYNLEGNAAEMTSTEGIAMGGSFRQYAGECTSEHEQSYSGPQDWVGFRYIVTMR